METNARNFDASKLKRKKITADIIKLSDLEVGNSVMGIYKSTSERPWLDKETGEEKTITQVHFENPANGERFLVFADAGFKNALSSAGVEENDMIEAVKLEQVALANGRRVNQYDIFQLTH